MHRQIHRIAAFAATGLIAATLAGRAEDKPAAAAAPAMDAKAMGEAFAKLAALNENHKQLAYFVGTWDCQVKMWMDPSAPPQESTGVSTTKDVWGGRYYHTDYTGKMEMPGPDGKPVSQDFMGMGLIGYDNGKQKFFSAWADTMMTGPMMLDGTYDAGTKTYTYAGAMECPLAGPGGKMKIRQVLKITGADQYTVEMFEDRGGKEVRTLEITYARRK